MTKPPGLGRDYWVFTALGLPEVGWVLPGIQDVLNPPQPLKRVYKVVTIDAHTSVVKSVRIRSDT